MGRPERRRSAEAAPAGTAGASTDQTVVADDHPVVTPEVREAREDVEERNRTGRALLRRVHWRLVVLLVSADLVGLAVVVACIVMLPNQDVDFTTPVIVFNAIGAGVALLIIIPVVSFWMSRWARTGRLWLFEDREPTDAEVTTVLRAPLRTFIVHVVLWTMAAVAFAAANAVADTDWITRIGLPMLFGGLSTAGAAYLITERQIRPLAAAALSVRGLDSPRLPGVMTRTLVMCGLGTGIPLVGLVTLGGFTLIDQKGTTVTSMAISVIIIASAAILAGWWVTALTAKAIADPVRSLGAGISRVRDGDFHYRVPVYDGSVLGSLQAGFNDMTAGLAERERMRDLYARQVGRDVADASLASGFEPGGEAVDVAVLFADVVGSTGLAAARPPVEVVAMLNRFFAVVVDEVDRHGGWINKFQGDATLAVFGAPVDLPDPAGQALAAARAVSRRLAAEVPELGAGIGVAYGPAVAGHVGSEHRFEFTVIGDPVNEAARLTELAKEHRPMVLASSATVAAASAPEATRWEVGGRADLRGRTAATTLARPVSLVDEPRPTAIPASSDPPPPRRNRRRRRRRASTSSPPR